MSRRQVSYYLDQDTINDINVVSGLKDVKKSTLVEGYIKEGLKRDEHLVKEYIDGKRVANEKENTISEVEGEKISNNNISLTEEDKKRIIGETGVNPFSWEMIDKKYAELGSIEELIDFLKNRN